MTQHVHANILPHVHPWDSETGWTVVPGEDDGVREWVPMRSANGHIGWFHRHADGTFEGNHVRVIARVHGGRGKVPVCKGCGKERPLGAFRLKKAP